MAYIPPPLPQALAPAPRGLGQAIAVGSAVAIACAFAVGLIEAMANTQFAYAAILLGIIVGRSVRRIRCDTQAAIAAGLISLAGGALASLIGLTVHLVRAFHIPLPAMLTHLPTVISILPHAIGPFGFLCWALGAAAGWANGRGPGVPGARGKTATAGPGPLYSPARQPGDAPGGQPQHPGPGPAPPPGQPPGLGPAQSPGAW